MKRIFTATLFILIAFTWSMSAFAQSESRAESRESLLRQIEAKHVELQQIEKQFLAPSQEDLDAYAKFLSQPETGLIRLLPREIYDSSNHPEKRLTIPGGGSFFSFTRHAHEYGREIQIGLEQGSLNGSLVGANYGIITNLGEVPLETVTSDLPALTFLGQYEPPALEPLARSEYKRFAGGVSVENASYNIRIKAVANNTYALRSIGYSDETDVLVVFHIVREDIDGSVIIAWKLLKKYPKPQLARSNQ